MLKLCGITKDYVSESDRVAALKGIDLSFRENEFVSILGPSGCGKTTLLNLIGGLDQYTDGDLIIGGKSTKNFTASDWDSYRNHSVGFVFQSYNLIPHQSVLANVELALTLSGVSKAERRHRAAEALKKVGLADQMKKRPNQLSGGQMQRVAIARALVNNPDILLADEPTGALDSTTSVQIMDLLKEVAKDKLVIMVTHNPSLAEEYSTRIIKLLDGKVVDDSAPFDGEMEAARKEEASKKPSMSFFTALSLSLNNLMTKKGRTLLTAFAGSIGIIGIALILSLSNGINQYIRRVQEDTLSNYPITIQAESVDLSGVLTTLMGARRDELGEEHELDAVYSSSVMSELINSFTNAQINTNNLKDFRKYLEDENNEIRSYLSDIQYSYDLDLNIYIKDSEGKIRESNIEAMMKEIYEGMGVSSDAFDRMSGMSFSNLRLWEEMLAGENGEGVSDLVQNQYDLIYGQWPQSYDEVVLVVDENNELSDMMLGALGLKSMEEMKEEMQAARRGETIEIDQKSFSYEEILDLEFRLYLTPDLYQKNIGEGYTLLTGTENGLSFLFDGDRGIKLHISGIIRESEDAVSGMLSGAIGYTAALTRYIIEETEKADIVQKQLQEPETDVLLSLPFRTEDDPLPTEEEKAEDIRSYMEAASEEKKAEMYTAVTARPSEEYVAATVENAIGNLSRAELEAQVMDYFKEQEEEGTDLSYVAEYVAGMSDDELRNSISENLAEMVRASYAEETKKSLAAMPAIQLAAALDMALAQNSYTTDQMVYLYDSFMPATFSESTYQDVLKEIGYVDMESPSVINLYADTFKDKDAIADYIAAYNEGKEEEDQINYTDYIALLMSSVSTIINAISYVLVAFVAVSLVVSSIMIGIITYISVLERTKEIGILRAIGASKGDISLVFNAETLIEGFSAGAIGIGVTLLLILPINLIIRHLTGIMSLGASLPVAGAVILVLISMILTYVAGLIPSGIAARKDPVEALRSE